MARARPGRQRAQAAVGQPVLGCVIDGGGEQPRSRRRVMREELVEVVPDRRIASALLAGLPLRSCRAGFNLTPVHGGTEVDWQASFDGLSRRLRDPAAAGSPGPAA